MREIYQKIRSQNIDTALGYVNILTQACVNTCDGDDTMKTTQVSGFGEMVVVVSGKVGRSTPALKNQEFTPVIANWSTPLTADGSLDINAMFAKQGAGKVIAQRVAFSNQMAHDVLCRWFWTDYFTGAMVSTVQDVLLCSPLKGEHKRTMKNSLVKCVDTLSEGTEKLIVTEDAGTLNVEIQKVEQASVIDKRVVALAKAIFADQNRGNDTDMNTLLLNISNEVYKLEKKRAEQTAKRLSRVIKTAGKITDNTKTQNEFVKSLSPAVRRRKTA